MVASINPRDAVPLNLHTLLDRGTMLQPDNLIVTKIAGGYHKMTFKQHMLNTYRLASALKSWGVRFGDTVGTLMWNSACHLHAYHAISCMGAVLHTLNLRLGPKDLTYIIEHAEDRVIIVDFDLLQLLERVDDRVMSRIELILVVGEDYQPGRWQAPAKFAERCQDILTFLAQGSDDFVWPVLPETATHALCYTSGTTGRPKGVAYSQRSTYLHTLVVPTHADQLAVKGSDVVLQFIPMFHVLGWGIPFATLMLGTRTIFSGRYMDPDSILDCCIDWKVTTTAGVPTVWQGLRALIEARGIDTIRPQLALNTITCGGSQPPLEMMIWFDEKLGVEMAQGCGTTEGVFTSLGRKVAKWKDLSRSPDELNDNRGKAGLLMPGLEIRVAQPEDLSKDQPRGEPGELLVRGPWVIQEYFKEPALDKFHDGYLITGDIAKLDQEGAIIICDRSKDVVKSGGEWISSIDMENLVVAIPQVAIAAVVAVPHPKWGERPVVVVTLAQGASGDGLLDKIRAHLASDFAKFQLPDDAVIWPEIPLTSTGKLDKKVIRQQLEKEGYVLPELRKSKL